MNKLPKIIVNPEICHGKPVIEGTRIMVWQILELLEAGGKPQDIYDEYPELPEDSIKAVLHYAAERAKFESYAAFDKKTGNQVFT